MPNVHLSSKFSSYKHSHCLRFKNSRSSFQCISSAFSSFAYQLHRHFTPHTNFNLPPHTQSGTAEVTRLYQDFSVAALPTHLCRTPVWDGSTSFRPLQAIRLPLRFHQQIRRIRRILMAMMDKLK